MTHPHAAGRTRTVVPTFESGARMMNEAVKSEQKDAYFADPADPLHSAFKAKAVIHSGPGGMPLTGDAARAKLDALTERPRSGKTLAYLHVPFCETRCLYCMFYQNPYSEEASRHYADRLIREISFWRGRAVLETAPVHAVYFGGGTPTALLPDDLRRVLSALKSTLPLANDCEITLEGRIHNFSDEKIEAALEGGVNRFSIGVQTFNSHVRQSVQRVDGRETIARRLEKLASYDQAAVVIDLIYGFPGQTPEIWADDLATASELPLDGVDCYQLNVFEKSPMARYIAVGKLPEAADTALKADFFAHSVDFFTRAGWRRLSNNHWARTSRERNIYNALGKGPCDCLAFGCGAGGRLAGHSFMTERKLDLWSAAVDAGVKPVGMLLAPGPHWHFLRTVSSDMESGEINLDAIGRRFGLPAAALVSDITSQWVEAGLLTPVGPRLTQTVAGQYWHVTMAQLLVEAFTKRLGAAGTAKPMGEGAFHGMPARYGEGAHRAG